MPECYSAKHCLFPVVLSSTFWMGPFCVEFACSHGASLDFVWACSAHWRLCATHGCLCFCVGPAMDKQTSWGQALLCSCAFQSKELQEQILLHDKNWNTQKRFLCFYYLFWHTVSRGELNKTKTQIQTAYLISLIRKLGTYTLDYRFPSQFVS